jgi:hypothetical protein
MILAQSRVLASLFHEGKASENHGKTVETAWDCRLDFEMRIDGKGAN